LAFDRRFVPEFLACPWKEGSVMTIPMDSDGPPSAGDSAVPTASASSATASPSVSRSTSALAPATVPNAVSPPSAVDGETVLLVEDEDQVRGLVRDVLLARGYRVLEASGGADALASLEQDQPVHLLLSDLVMPGLTGAELAERARALRPGLRVLFVSGHADEKTVRDGLRGAYLAKPFTSDSLSRKIREVLDQPAE
jgi:CheY-like chemotaxis protein